MCGTLGRAETGGAGRRGDVGGDMGGLGLCGEVTGRKSGLVGGDEARKMGEGGAREKGETMGELRGEDAVLSSALAKMKAVSVRLRWYRLSGLPGEEKKKQLVRTTNCLHCNRTPLFCSSGCTYQCGRIQGWWDSVTMMMTAA